MKNPENTLYKKVTFAGGCFWCTVVPFESLPGIISVVSGYAGGTKPYPTYEEVSTGTSGYREAVQIIYDPSKISYETLLKLYWQQIDPTDENGQFYDQATQYTTTIYVHDEEQRLAAEQSKKALETSKRFAKPVVTQILPFTSFYPAEEYHQKYHTKNPEHYKKYRKASGRDDYLKRVWNTY